MIMLRWPAAKCEIVVTLPGKVETMKRSMRRIELWFISEGAERLQEARELRPRSKPSERDLRQRSISKSLTAYLPWMDS